MEVFKSKLLDSQVDLNKYYRMFHSYLKSEETLMCGITPIEVGITSQDSLQIEYDLLENDTGLIYKYGIVTKYHKTYLKKLQIPKNVEAYIQSIVLRKTKDGVKTKITRNIILLILDDIITAEEPTISMNKDSDLNNIMNG
ncbi:hypothetical protein CWI38_0030p0080 [Hamiltosporidium tvaerminnensis]|uniref:Uncharacterized protein n=1 Tax=Hamiltosporidium tvaerminnensis TaxID=1176355 RepID=A0A4Q9M1W1_9MICR|nr:hypothetical protein CWI38_0030p0080 [Hamiltosporidium tvaerminnensis]